MSDDSRLAQIQKLQTTDKAGAEALLLAFVRENFPQLHAAAMELRPSAVSLNSFNGYLTDDDGKKFFFKTHVEPGSIVNEYYNSRLLADAGYPIIHPAFTSIEYGKQFLVYELIEAVSLFDFARQLDLGQDENNLGFGWEQEDSDKKLFRTYQRTLDWQTAEDAARAPVHQLFYHRLMGARVHEFYIPADALPRIPLNTRWIINGRRYNSSLQELIAQQNLIRPEQPGPGIIGHGDAHNGNIFYFPDAYGNAPLTYFDPAFAGRHSPFLDLAKPLFHNVFAAWLYHPTNYTDDLVSVREEPGEVTITMNEMPPVHRLEIFYDSKVNNVLVPIMVELKRRGWLQDNWRAYLKTALFCCPFLTMNLTDETRFPEPIKWLGLAWSVIMGSESEGSEKSLLDETLDEIEANL